MSAVNILCSAETVVHVCSLAYSFLRQNSLGYQKPANRTAKEQRLIFPEFKKIIGNQNFSDLFKQIVNRFKNVGYNLLIMRQTACLGFNTIMVENYAALLRCTALVQREITIITNSHYTRKYTANRMSSSFPKGGHSAT